MRKITPEIVDFIMVGVQEGRYGDPLGVKTIQWKKMYEDVNDKFGTNISYETFRHSKEINFRLRNPSTKKETTPLNYKILINRIHSLEKQLEKRDALHENLVNGIQTAMATVEFPQKIVVPKPIISKHDDKFVAVWSDWHGGLYFLPDQTYTGWPFNKEILSENVDVLTERMIYFKKKDEAYSGLNHLYIFMLGDMCEGSRMRPNQPFQLDIRPPFQEVFVWQLIYDSILKLHTVFPKITVLIIPGNHRHGKYNEMPDNDRPDFILAHYIGFSLLQYKNIDVWMCGGNRGMWKIGNHTFLLGHGNHIRSWQGFPHYGFAKDFANVNIATKGLVDYEIIGHFHESQQSGMWGIVNGCMMGATPYSEQKYVSEKPNQIIFYLSEKYIHNRNNIVVRDNPPLVANEYGNYGQFTNIKEMVHNE